MNESKKVFFEVFDKLIVDTNSTDFNVDFLCKSAGYKRQTFYYDFRSKQDFLISYFRHIFSKLIVPMEKLDKEDALNFLSSFIKMFHKRNSLIRNILFSDDYREIMTDFFKESYISKIILLIPSISKETIIVLSGTLFRLAFESSLNNELDFDVDLLADELLAVIKIGSVDPKKRRRNN